ncbi:MAG TPA: hypothetical protein PK772_07720 [Chitinophagaceae bacterium]|nr:hypothetical protein [Chitinophagaceae bacterium]
MRFSDKYSFLKDKQLLTELLVKTVYTTMALENQKVEEQKVRAIIRSLFKQPSLRTYRKYL